MGVQQPNVVYVQGQPQHKTVYVQDSNKGSGKMLAGKANCFFFFIFFFFFGGGGYVQGQPQHKTVYVQDSNKGSGKMLAGKIMDISIFFFFFFCFCFCFFGGEMVVIIQPGRRQFCTYFFCMISIRGHPFFCTVFEIQTMFVFGWVYFRKVAVQILTREKNCRALVLNKNSKVYCYIFSIL